MEDVIFAGTRERKPTGMAEVSLTLVDPQVYEGQISGVPEIDIQDDLPIPEDDWDEASVRSTAADATEAAIAEVQPGPLDGLPGEAEAGVSSETSIAAATDADAATSNQTNESAEAADASGTSEPVAASPTDCNSG